LKFEKDTTWYESWFPIPGAFKINFSRMPLP
jgi:hypothetical protein